MTQDFDELTRTALISMCDKLFAELAAAKEENRWIPVGERLPERHVFCDIYMPEFNKCCPQRGWYNPDKQTWLTTTKGWGMTRKVTHWKPITLPKE